MSISAQDNHSIASGYDPVLDDVIEEMANRLQAGEPVDGAAILAKYPDRADSIRRLLPAMEVMAEFGVSASRLAAAGVSPGLRPLTGELGTLGDFRILREVGRGGMGIVYEAEQVSLGRRVALKVLPFAGAMDPQHLRRFRTEAQAAAQLHHTNIVPVYWIGCENGVHYYAMQFIEGRTLADVIRELRQLEGKDRRGDTAGQDEAPDDLAASALASALSRESPPPAAREDVPPPAAAPDPPGPSAGRTPAPPSASSTRNRAYFRNVARLGLEAAEALEHAHQEGIVHRDIKPANLMVDARGHLWVTDFGLARLQNDSGLTVTGDLLGTLRYMSPEQALGRRAYLDHRTDIYSLGVTLYELSTLEPAFESRDRAALLRRITDEEPRAPRKVDESIPRELETIVLKAMAKEPEGRYTSAQELADDLRRFLEHKPIRARRPRLVERVAKWSRRHRGIVVSTGLLLVLAFTGMAVATALIDHQRRQALANLKTANEQRDLATARTRELAAAYESQERRLYIDRVSRAHGEWRENNIALARQLLAECPEDRRGWEWHYCQRLCHLERLTLRVRGWPFLSLAFSLDGRWMVTTANSSPSGEGSGEWTIWDATTGRAIECRPAPRACIVAVNSSGTMVASASHGAEKAHARVELWTISPDWPLKLAREPARILRTHDGAINHVAFSPDGRQIVTVSWDGTAFSSILEFWDVDTGRKRNVIDLSGRHVLGAAVHRDGKQFTTAGIGGSVQIHDTKDGKVLRELSGHGGEVFDVTYTPDGQRIVTGGWDKTVRVWEAASGNPIHVLRGHDSFVRAVAINHDGTRIASASEDNTVRIWDADRGEEIAMLRGHQRFVLDTAFSRDGHRVASASEDGTVKIWDESASETARTLRHSNWVPSLSFLPDSLHLAAVCWDGTITLWDAEEGRKLQSIPCHERRIISMACRADGTVVAETNEDGEIRLWDISTSRLLKTLAGHQGYCFGIAFRPDGRQLASTGMDGTLRLWDVGTGKSSQIFRAPPGVQSVATVYRPDGREFAAAFTDGKVRIFNAADGRERIQLDCRVNAGAGPAVAGMLAYDPTGNRLAGCSNMENSAGDRDPGEVRIFDATTGQRLFTLRGHTSNVVAVAFDPTGTRLASSSFDRTIKVWETETGQEVLTLRGHSGGVLSVSFSPDGRRLATGSIDSTVRVWDATPRLAADPGVTNDRKEEGPTERSNP